MNRYPDPRRSKVVLVGTSDYEHDKKLSRLPAIRNNLVGLEGAFTNPSTGVFTSENCMVVDTPDSPKSMMQRLTRAAREAEDVFVAYYAGDGILGLRSKLYLSVRETDDQQLEGTAVPFEWVRDAIQGSPADIRILILDCCFSGRAIGAMSSDSAALEQIDITGTSILTSTTANDISHSIPGERYTAFTAELIRLLTRPYDGVLTLGGLYRPLSVAMARRNLPSPKSSIGDSSGGIILQRPTTPQHAPENFIKSDAGPKETQAPHKPAPSPSPAPQGNNLWNKGATVSPATSQRREDLFLPPRTPSRERPLEAFSSQWPTPLHTHSASQYAISQWVAPIKRAAPFFAMIVLTLSAMFAAIVLGVAINQGVSGPPTEGVAGLAIAIAFVVAWFIASILLLARVLKRTLRQRQRRKRNFMNSVI